ncbi:MFS transporter [Neobacillus massiliamazoniensis]|uniref:Hexuronate transporter n=1 Tax=Neobacillus massiliamazoniensis TaxID=1499688 RepID=A0A0U1NZI7_9BACI|nr:MFS transporter [Neobacillus massiliamazoniensis]CRK83403.1 hexuronate transporter [Neobacillus massiliamazoniensis]
MDKSLLMSKKPLESSRKYSWVLWGIITFLFFGNLINFSEKNIVGYSAELIMKDFGLNSSQWGLVGSAYYWIFPIAGIIGAAFSDRFGTKKILSILMLSWGVLQFGALAINGFSALILYRVLLGIFQGPFGPVALSHINKWFPAEKRGVTSSLFTLGATTGGLVLAPVIVGLTTFGWKVAFAVFGGVSVIWFLLFMITTKESPSSIEQKAATKNTVENSIQKKSSKEVVKAIFSPTSIFTLFLAFSSFIFVVWTAIWMPNFLTKVTGLTSSQMGVAVSIVGISSAAIIFLVSMVSDKVLAKTKNWRLSRVVVTGVSAVIGSMLLASVVFIPNPIWNIIAFGVAYGLTGANFAIAPQIMMTLVPERSGLMASILMSFQNVGGMIAPVATGFLIGLSKDNIIQGYNNSILIVSGAILLCSLLFLLFVNPNLKKQA